MDSRPFEDLPHIVRKLKDSRVWTYADWIGPDLTPKTPQGHWTKFYHNRLYNLTDEAARACSPDTRWVVFTNGDNVYHEDAFSYLDASDADAVAWDFYSRYYRPTGIPCERFIARDSTPPCKVNRMRFCHSDLGGVAYSWPRLVTEDKRFGALDSTGEFTGQDGRMTELVRAAGWRVDHAEGKCLFDQGPSPQMCYRSGGVWDDRFGGQQDDFGGHCITKEAAEVAMRDPSVEVLEIELNSDGKLGGFTESGGAEAVHPMITCLRPATDYKYMLARVFGITCSEEMDEHIFKEMAQEHRTAVKSQEEHPLNVNAREPEPDARIEWYKKAYRKPTAPIPRFPDQHQTSKRARMADESKKDEL